MTDYDIKIIRAAFREIQKLPHQYFEDVAHIVTEMAKGFLGDKKKLKGYKNLWRTKNNDARVIWTQERTTNEILIIKAGKRNDVYQGLIGDRHISNPLPLSHLLDIEEEKLNDIPTYQWSNFDTKSWYQFVYGDFLYSPILTNEQREVFKIAKNYSSDKEIHSILIQSAPGTGKTVAAVLVACKFYKDQIPPDSANIVIILPQNLCQEIKKFTNVKKILEEKPVNFFIGTLREYFEHNCPIDFSSNVATLEEELSAIQKELRTVHCISETQNLQEKDVILYRFFIDNRNQFDSKNSPFYEQNKPIIEKLNNIKKENWIRTLAPKRSWLDGLEEFTPNILPPENTNKSLLIFDEAQDYLIDEFNVVKNILRRWKEEHNHDSTLIILGDLNQRIYPIDFDWGHLHLNTKQEREQCQLKYNYRNTKYILEYANSFLYFAEQANSGNRRLPSVTDSNSSFEVGEPVQILECNEKQDALKLLCELDQKIQHLASENKRSILSKLSRKLPVISLNKSDSSYQGLEYINVQQAKGREFDACVAFCIFEGEREPSIEEANNWYTTLTRPRYRLLVIATSQEIERIGRDRFEKCKHYNFADKDTPLNWIIEWASSDYLLKDIDAITNLILEGLNEDPPQIYWDTYAALRKANIGNEKLNYIESQAIKILKLKDKSFLEDEFSQIVSAGDIDRIPLKCLLLRVLERSWQAVGVIAELKQLNNQQEEYKRLLNGIADDLKNSNLPYESARVKAIIEPSLLDKLPFGSEIKGKQGSLVSLLSKAAITKITTDNIL